MEWGEAVLFFKFVRSEAPDEYRPLRAKRAETLAKYIQEKDPGLWFRWLAYRAVMKGKPHR